MTTERDRPRPATTPAIPPPAWPGALVGAALGGVVGALSLLVPVDPTPLRPGPPSATGTGAPVAPTATASAPASASVSAAGASSAPASSGAASRPAAEGETEAEYLARATGLIRTAPAEALALAEGHAGRFPESKLGQEREMIAVSSLAALGRKAEARARAKLFLTLFPESAHRPRIEDLLPELGEKKSSP